MTKLTVKTARKPNLGRAEPVKESPSQTVVPLDPLERVALMEYLLTELRGLEDGCLADRPGTDIKEKQG